LMAPILCNPPPPGTKHPPPPATPPRPPPKKKTTPPPKPKPPPPHQPEKNVGGVSMAKSPWSERDSPLLSWKGEFRRLALQRKTSRFS